MTTMIDRVEMKTSLKVQKELPGTLPEENGITVRVVTVTPELAEQWLAKNQGNRLPKKEAISKYARDMERKSWPLTGETIIFDTNGYLRNGQNRCYAIMKGGTAIEALVVWGIAPKAFMYMDAGVKRSIADILQIKGETNASALAAAAVYVWRDEQGLPLGGSRGNTTNDTLDVLARYPEIRQSVRWRSDATTAGLVPGLAVYLHWKLARVDGGMADVFFDALYSLEGLFVGNPVLQLNKQLRLVSKGKRSSEFRAIYTIKTWNAWGAGKTIGQLKFDPREAFPVPEVPTSQRWLLPIPEVPTSQRWLPPIPTSSER